MIYMYTGTPGSGKSLHTARDILINSKRKRNYILCNFEINKTMLKYPQNIIEYDMFSVEPQYFIDWSIKNLEPRRENQALIIVDECQLIFNSREWQSSKNRMAWIQFFTQHRKFGYNVILITQYDRMVDRQIRALVEYEVVHRKVNNYKLGKFIPVPVFAAITKWYGINEVISRDFFIFRKKHSKIYDSYHNWQREDLTTTIEKSKKGVQGSPSSFLDRNSNEIDCNSNEIDRKSNENVKIGVDTIT